MEYDDPDFQAFKAKALWDFQPDAENGESGEIAISAGDVVTVISESEDSEWSQIRNKKNEKGWVPSNYLKQIDSKPSPRPARPPPKKSPVRTNDYIVSTNDYEDPPTPREAAPGSGHWGMGVHSSEGQIRMNTPVKRARTETHALDESVAYNLFAAGTEWWCCVCLFFSGVFSVMWGSMQSPENTTVEAFGSIQCIVAGFLLVYFALCRETCCFCSEGCQDKTSLLRMTLLIAATIPCWPAYPMGWIGLAACIIAACANGWVYLMNGQVLSEAGVEVQWLTMNVEVCRVFNNNGIMIVLFTAVVACLNVLFYMIGEKIGTDRIEFERTENLLTLGPKFSEAEAFGTIISMNIVLLFLSGLKGFQRWVKLNASVYIKEFDDTAGSDPCLIKRSILKSFKWFFNEDTQILLHRTSAASIVIGCVGHFAANFLAYEDSGPANDYYEVFGLETVVTGFLMIIFLIPIFSVSNYQIKHVNPTLFKWTHMCWVVVVILLLMHGKADPVPWNSNFWKFILGPSIVYLFDVFYVRGLDARS